MIALIAGVFSKGACVSKIATVFVGFREPPRFFYQVLEISMGSVYVLVHIKTVRSGLGTAKKPQDLGKRE